MQEAEAALNGHAVEAATLDLMERQDTDALGLVPLKFPKTSFATAARKQAADPDQKMQ